MSRRSNGYQSIEDGGHLFRTKTNAAFAPDWSGKIRFEGRVLRANTWLEKDNRLMIQLVEAGGATPIAES